MGNLLDLFDLIKCLYTTRGVHRECFMLNFLRFVTISERVLESDTTLFGRRAINHWRWHEALNKIKNKLTISKRRIPNNETYMFANSSISDHWLTEALLIPAHHASTCLSWINCECCQLWFICIGIPRQRIALVVYNRFGRMRHFIDKLCDTIAVL